MAKGGKNFQSKPAGKQAIQPGPSGKMNKFKAVGTQAPGGTAVAGSGGSKSWPSDIAGPSGKMQKFTPVKPQKPGVSSVTNSGGGYSKKGK
jgi:hypothetical protein